MKISIFLFLFYFIYNNNIFFIIIFLILLIKCLENLLIINSIRSLFKTAMCVKDIVAQIFSYSFLEVKYTLEIADTISYVANCLP